MRRLTWHNASQSDQQLREYLILALLRSRTCVTLQDGELEYLYIANLPGIWSVASGQAPTDETVFGPMWGKKLKAVKTSALATGEAGSLEISVFEYVFEVHVETISAQKGGTQVLTTIVDVTEARQREKILKDLLLEVSHRSKNLLAVIQSLATQTARFSGSLEQFQTEFRGRIFSLAKSQDLVTEADWYGIGIFDLARAQLDVSETGAADEIRFDGENLVLTPNAALHIGLGLHELMAHPLNGYGQPNQGRFSLSCVVNHGNAHANAELLWKEELSPHAAADDEDAGGKFYFSGLLLKDVIPQALDGNAQYSVSGGERIYRLVFPLTTYSVRLGTGAGVQDETLSSVFEAE